MQSAAICGSLQTIDRLVYGAAMNRLIPLLCAGLALASCGNSEVEDAVRSQMRDPDSVKFRDIARCSHDRDMWQGDYNAKNGFGAYTGYQPFFVKNGVATLLTDPGFSGLIQECFGDQK